MLKTIGPHRSDSMGNGEFGAPRGSRTHNGIDYAVAPDAKVLAIRGGKVTKLGYPYPPSDPKKGKFRYVEVTDMNDHKVRYFYTLPTVAVGDLISMDDPIGIAQDLRDAYGDAMTPHVHVEVKDRDGKFIHPEEYLL